MCGIRVARLFAILGAGTLGLLLVTACGPAERQTAEPGGRLTLVATTTQIRALTEAVAGDRATVRSILPPGADAHDFEPRPSDLQAIAASALVLKNGIGLDSWVDRLIANAGGARPLVTVTEGVPLRAGGPHPADTQAGATPVAREQVEEEGLDPHVWFSTANAMTMTRNIRAALVQVDPAGAAVYEANTTAYLGKLAELDQYIKDQVATIPPERRKVVTNHDAFGYYFDRYGLIFVGSIIPSLSSEAQPSAQDVAELIRKIRAEQVQAIFLESSINPALAKQVGDEAGVRVVDTLYGDALGPPGSPGATYEGMMRYNTDTIVPALKGAP
jgi:zinc/manganese transport system substrate-binding protein/manganese/iron transport system substrate-binding protein